MLLAKYSMGDGRRKVLRDVGRERLHQLGVRILTAELALACEGILLSNSSREPGRTSALEFSGK